MDCSRLLSSVSILFNGSAWLRTDQPGGDKKKHKDFPPLKSISQTAKKNDKKLKKLYGIALLTYEMDLQKRLSEY